jgi:nucleoside-diphosphate kinase
MGPTHKEKALQANPNCIRALYGYSDTRNAVHGSDSEETALKEIKFFFPDFIQTTINDA